MFEVAWNLKRTDALGEINKELYGGFVEHLGRNVYGGVYDPASPVADEDGFRKDVMDLIRDLNMPVTRYPGGCYVDLERWEDSVGANRRSRIDPAWHQLEPNTFGLDEFMKWARKVNTEPLMTVNVGNRSLLDTLSLYEYCNIPGGTYWSDQRRANGVEKPYNIKNWCIGNELYGSWEMGQMSAAEYGRIAREHGKMLKKLDPNCRIIVSGSPYDMKWNRTVLEICGMYADVLSLHDAFAQLGDMTELQYLKTVDRFEKYLTDTIKECKAYEALSGRRVKVSVDEWIIWDFERRMNPAEEWTSGMHLLEQDYTILDALIAGSLFSCFHRHCDWVETACIAQSVNVIAPIRTEDDGTSWRQSIYFPFQLTSKYGRGISLIPEESGNDEKSLYGSAVLDESAKLLTLFVTNRSGEPCSFTAEFADAAALADAVTMYNSDHALTNSATSEVLQPQSLECAFSGKRVNATLAGCSWNMIQLALA
jgi:alpha-N-arabinofuranosidase